MKIIVNNLATEYEDVGQGEAMLMLHGWGVDLHSFDKIVERLKDKYRIIRLDLPGFGQTETPKNWNLESYVNFVREFLDKTLIKPKFLLGHSFGGRVIIKGVGEGKLAAQKIILISPAGVSLFNMKKSLMRIVSKIGKFLLYVPPIYFWKESIRKRFYKNIGSEYLDNSKMKEIFGNVVSEDLTPYAKNIKEKTLLIWGEQDMVTPLADGKFLNSVVPDSKLEVIPNTGHFSFVEDPDSVASLIDGFII